MRKNTAAGKSYFNFTPLNLNAATGAQANAPTAEQTGAKVRPIAWTEAHDLMRQRFKSNEYWIGVFDGDAGRLLERIEEKYYTGEANRDFDLIAVAHDGYIFAVVAMRKVRMFAWQFRSLLRQIIGLNVTEREILRRDVLIIATPGRLGSATMLAERLLRAEGDNSRVPASTVPTYDASL